MTTQSNTPVKKEDGTVDVPRSSGAEVDAFLACLKTITPAGSARGRLNFAMDATMSRQGGRKALQAYGSATKSGAR